MSILLVEKFQHFIYKMRERHLTHNSYTLTEVGYKGRKIAGTALVECMQPLHRGM